MDFFILGFELDCRRSYIKSKMFIFYQNEMKGEMRFERMVLTSVSCICPPPNDTSPTICHRTLFAFYRQMTLPIRVISLMAKESLRQKQVPNQLAQIRRRMV